MSGELERKRAELAEAERDDACMRLGAARIYRESLEKQKRQVEAELAELRATMMGDSRERIEQVQADMDALPEEERVRREAANAPLLRIQLAHFVGEGQRLKEELARASKAAAEEIWAKLGMNAILDWSRRAETAEAAIERAKAEHTDDGAGACETCSNEDPTGLHEFRVLMPCPTLKALGGGE